MMTKLKIAIVATGLAACLVYLTGCVSPSLNPLYSASAPTAQPEYLPNTNTMATIAQLQPIVQAAVPAPYNGVAEALLGLCALATTAFAAWKNNSANAANTQLASVLGVVNTVNHPQTVQAVNQTLANS